MSGAVGNEGDEVHVLAFLASQQTVNGVDNHLDDVNVLPLVEAADVVCLGNLTLMEDEVDSTGVVFHEQPVAHVLALAIYWQRFAVADVVDEQRNQLLRELIWTIVVRAVGHHHRHSVGVVECAHEVVARSLRCRVWRVRVVFRCLKEELVAVSQMMLCRRCCCCERRLDTLGVSQFQRAVHLVGRDVIEALALIFLRQRLPVELSGLEQRERTHHVGLSEGERVFDRAVHMTLGGEVYDTIHLLLLHQFVECVEVADVHLHKLIVRLVLDVLEVGEVACISQFVEIDDVVVGILVHEQSHYMTSNKSGTAGDNDCLHNYVVFINNVEY